MGKGTIIGIIIIIISAGLILTYTNAFDVLKQEISPSIDTIKKEVSKVEGKDVVEKAEETSEKIKEITEKIKLTESMETKDNKSQTEIQKLEGIAYSPYRKGQSPITGPHPNPEEIENDIKLLSSITDKIRIYGTDGNSSIVPDIAKKYGVKTAITLLLTGDKSDDDKIKQAVQLANNNDFIYTIIVENEGLYRNTLTEEQIINYIYQTKEKLNPRCIITIAEPVGNWLEHKEIAKHVDYVMIHYYPYWNGIPIDKAVDSVVDEYNNVKNTLGKEVVIGETGWPTDGLPIENVLSSKEEALPSKENQKKFIEKFKDIAEKNDIDYYLFEAFDESWKKDEQIGSDTENNYAEKHWGLFYENGNPKNDLKNIIPLTIHTTTRN